MTKNNPPRPQAVATPTAMTIDDLRTSRKAVLTLADVAAVMGVDPRTVSGAAKAGDIPSIRMGARVLIPREAFLTYLDGQRIAS